MSNKKRKTNKGKKLEKPLSLYPLTVEEITAIMLKTPPLKNEKKSRKLKEEAKS